MIYQILEREIKPKIVYKWFMEMLLTHQIGYGPYVYGMGLFSDGGIFPNHIFVVQVTL